MKTSCKKCGEEVDGSLKSMLLHLHNAHNLHHILFCAICGSIQPVTYLNGGPREICVECQEAASQ